MAGSSRGRYSPEYREAEKRDIKQLRMERDILKRRSLVREGERIDPQRGYAFMRANRARFPLAAMCRVLGLSTSGYQGWLRRELPADSKRFPRPPASPGRRSGSPPGDRGLRFSQRRLLRALQPSRNPPLIWPSDCPTK